MRWYSSASFSAAIWALKVSKDSTDDGKEGLSDDDSIAGRPSAPLSKKERTNFS